MLHSESRWRVFSGLRRRPWKMADREIHGGQSDKEKSEMLTFNTHTFKNESVNAESNAMFLKPFLVLVNSETLSLQLSPLSLSLASSNERVEA